MTEVKAYPTVWCCPLGQRLGKKGKRSAEPDSMCPPLWPAVDGGRTTVTGHGVGGPLPDWNAGSEALQNQGQVSALCSPPPGATCEAPEPAWHPGSKAWCPLSLSFLSSPVCHPLRPGGAPQIQIQNVLKDTHRTQVPKLFRPPGSCQGLDKGPRWGQDGAQGHAPGARAAGLRWGLVLWVLARVEAREGVVRDRGVSTAHPEPRAHAVGQSLCGQSRTPPPAPG